MVDKNHQHQRYTVSTNTIQSIRDALALNTSNIILCKDAFQKTRFLAMLATSAKEEPVIYVDTDLLYTGYVKANMISPINHTTNPVACPDGKSLLRQLSGVISDASHTKHWILIDSLNGVYATIIDDSEDDINSESTRLASTCMMLLTSMGRHANSIIVVATLARHLKDTNQWVTFPGGKRIVGGESMWGCVYILETIKSRDKDQMTLCKLSMG